MEAPAMTLVYPPDSRTTAMIAADAEIDAIMKTLQECANQPNERRLERLRWMALAAVDEYVDVYVREHRVLPPILQQIRQLLGLAG
jgi:hypothetical protein